MDVTWCLGGIVCVHVHEVFHDEEVRVGMYGIILRFVKLYATFCDV